MLAVELLVVPVEVAVERLLVVPVEVAVERLLVLELWLVLVERLGVVVDADDDWRLEVFCDEVAAERPLVVPVEVAVERLLVVPEVDWDEREELCCVAPCRVVDVWLDVAWVRGLDAAWRLLASRVTMVLGVAVLPVVRRVLAVEEVANCVGGLTVVVGLPPRVLPR